MVDAIDVVNVSRFQPGMMSVGVAFKPALRTLDPEPRIQNLNPVRRNWQMDFGRKALKARDC